jgi:hypothetical protein
MGKNNRESMHILILSPGFPTLLASQEGDFYGGSFVLTEALAYQLAGAKVTVLTPHVPGLPLREDLQDGLQVVRFRYFFPVGWQRIRKNSPCTLLSCCGGAFSNYHYL